MKKVSFLVTLALMSAVFLRSADAASFKALTKQGNRLYQKGMLDEALPQYNKAMTERPDSPIINFNAGNAFYKKKQYEEAIEAYQKALTTPDKRLEAGATYNIGNSKFRQGRLKESSDLAAAVAFYRTALDYYKRAMELAPDDKDAKFNHEFIERLLKALLDKLNKQQKQEQERQRQQQQQEQTGGGAQKQEQTEQGQKQKETAQKEEDKAEEGKKGEDKGGEGKKEGQQQVRPVGGQPQPQAPVPEMTEEEARMLLEDQRQQEQTGRQISRERRPARYMEVEKEW